MNILKNVIQPPKVEPVTINDVYEHTSADDEHADFLQPLIARARKRFEERTGRMLVEQTWQFALPMFSDVIELPISPLIQVVSVKYINNQGMVTTLDPSQYRVVDHGLTAMITPALGGRWPIPGYKVADAVRIECVVGHAPVVNQVVDAANIVDRDKYELAKQAILVLIADWFKNREDTAAVQLYEMPNAFKALCNELSVQLL